MKVLCPETCGFCKKPQTNAPTTTPSPAQQASACNDQRNDCFKLASGGFCKKQQKAMEKLCPRSCNVCPDGKKKVEESVSSVCVDKMKGCPVMLQRGFCQRNKKAMATRCQKTCNLCPTCADTRTNCQSYKTFGWCERKQSEMAGVCPVTCNLCHMVKAKPTPQAPCIDKHGERRCEKMERLGFCESRPLMKTECTKTCKMCPGISTPKPKTVTTTLTSTRVPGCKDAYGRVRCEYYSHIGWCDRYTKIKNNCHDTCVCNLKTTKAPTRPQNCQESRFGCCWDNKTEKRDASGTACPDCNDDRRFVVLCRRFGGDCSGNGGLAKSLRKHCARTCKLC